MLEEFNYSGYCHCVEGKYQPLHAMCLYP